MKVWFSLLFLVLALASCSSSETQGPNEPEWVDASLRYKSSTSVGNFVTTAVQRAYNLDFVFLPADYFSKDMVFKVEPGMSESQIQKVLSHFKRGPLDNLLIGSMKGKAIKEFIVNRSRETYQVELETAGLWYYVSFFGGIPQSEFLVEGRVQLDEDRYYRIAVSNEYYFGTAFPGYKFRNAFNFNFRRNRYMVSLREGIQKYLKEVYDFPVWNRERAVVLYDPAEPVGSKSISEIQGISHASPYLNKRVMTDGIITAIGTPEWYPWGTDIYIESINPDGDPRTSEGLHLHLSGFSTFGLDLKRGDHIGVSGVVFEDIRRNGMGETQLQFIDKIWLIEKEAHHKLPTPVHIGLKGRRVPTKTLSSYGGRLMEKNALNLSDGIDFWESLESMRVSMDDPIVLGFRGGQEDDYQVNSKPYVNLYVTPAEFVDPAMQTYHKGLLIDEPEGDRNPEVISFITNFLTHRKNLDETKFYSVGDQFKGRVEGLLVYNRNLFGGGEYVMVFPDEQAAFVQSGVPDKDKVGQKSKVPLAERPVATLTSPESNEITVATYNLENLSAFQINRQGQDRMDNMADSIVTNLKCPDILNLVEIQDNNGQDFRKTQDAQITIRKLRALVQSSCLDRDYAIVDVPPFLHAEGGQPGGNIRVSILYNAQKLGLEYRQDGAYGTPAVVQKRGRLSNNPGRVYPNHEVFRRTRRSLVVEFFLKSKPSEKLYVIGNHLNSKLGDIDFWGNRQIARPASDERRVKKAALLREFIQWIEVENPSAHVVVLGDFNALAQEDSMKILTDHGRFLKNMIFTLPKNKRYTTNHNGNSQPLDYIFVNQNVFNKLAPRAEILHINSDYMARLSDHDPVVLKVTF